MGIEISNKTNLWGWETDSAKALILDKNLVIVFASSSDAHLGSATVPLFLVPWLTTKSIGCNGQSSTAIVHRHSPVSGWPVQKHQLSRFFSFWRIGFNQHDIWTKILQPMTLHVRKAKILNENVLACTWIVTTTKCLEGFPKVNTCSSLKKFIFAMHS